MKCERCAGCGKIADSASGEPWVYWEALPVKSALAVVMGLVKPIPCPVCGGSGETQPDAAAVIAAAERLEHAWDALCRCVDEFEPEDKAACCERRDDLDAAVEAVIAALHGRAA